MIQSFTQEQSKKQQDFDSTERKHTHTETYNGILLDFNYLFSFKFIKIRETQLQIYTVYNTLMRVKKYIGIHGLNREACK